MPRTVHTSSDRYLDAARDFERAAYPHATDDQLRELVRNREILRKFRRWSPTSR